MTADTMGGVWTYAVELARVLVATGLEVGLAPWGLFYKSAADKSGSSPA